VALWVGVGAAAWVGGDHLDLNPVPFHVLTACSLGMALTWLPGMLRQWQRRRRLRGKPLARLPRPERARASPPACRGPLARLGL
jgi:hypothetical protein